jgi:hypothetical protein
MANGVLFNSSGSIVLALNYEIQGPYTDKFIVRKDTKTLTLEAEVFIRVGNTVLIVDTDEDIDESNLDAGAAYGNSTTYYIYACQPLDGSGVPVWRISANATYPAGGWTANNSRKIGGFITDGSGDIAASGNNLWDLQSQAVGGAVAESLFDANTILAADTDNTPAPVTIAEQTIVGRLTGGNIKAVSRTELTALLNAATEALQGAAPLASTTEVVTGTNVTKISTPAGVQAKAVDERVREAENCIEIIAYS